MAGPPASRPPEMRRVMPYFSCTHPTCFNTSFLILPTYRIDRDTGAGTEMPLVNGTAPYMVRCARCLTPHVVFEDENGWNIRAE